MKEINKLEDIKHKYGDIINLAYHGSVKREQMSIKKRAAQFAPFSALSGYDEQIKESSRLTYNKLEIDEDLKEIIDRKLQIINNNLDKKIMVSIKYFIKDEKKSGGKYIIINKCVKKIDQIYRKIIFIDNSSIDIDNILSLEIN